MADGEAFLKELLETFRLEAQDHLDALGSLLVLLEGEEDASRRGAQLERVLRHMHTLKGAAHAVNLVDVAQTCQELEGLLADLKRGDLAPEPAIFDRLHQGIDQLSARVAGGASPPAADYSFSAQGSPAGTRHNAVHTGADRLRSAAEPAHQSEPAQPSEAVKPARRPAPGTEKGAAETVRVPTRLLESLLLQAEELVSAKAAARVLLDEINAAARELAGRGALRSRARELAGDALRRPEGELIVPRLAAQLQEFCESDRRAEARLSALERGAERNLHLLGSLVDPLLEEMRKLHLLPFATLVEPFSKLVRDLGRELGKEAELTLAGGGLEVDRRILAELKEPLLHILRNVMDHGLETAPERRAAGKAARGRIGIELKLRDANHAELTVWDDGRGIDPARVREKALRLELVTPEAAERLGDAEALQLIFESGFSTSPRVTALSGRGVGLAIVREALERLGGHATVESRLGQGTWFAMTLPLSFALIRGVLVEVGGRACLLQAANVELTARLPLDQIRSVENRDTVLLGGEIFSLVSLSAVLELGYREPAEDEGHRQVVLLRAADRRIAFAVDRVVGVQEVLVKPLGNQLARVRNVAGATVLGDGKVVPVLNSNDLVRSALTGSLRGVLPAETAHPSRHRRLSVLVAEDSITSRTLLKNILESSGFLVATAIDGMDALTQLKTGSFDVVVSDVEMPRLDGFGLTAAIRADGRWANLPVILVTGLESRADRERGIEVGASAYVVKSSFDQGSLVEVIQRLG